MPRVKKSEIVTETATTTSTVATPKVAKAPKAAAVETTPASTDTQEVKPKKASKKAASTEATQEASTQEAATQEAAPVSSEFADFMTKLQQLGNLVNSLKSEFRTLEKKANKDLKSITKANAKRKRKNVNRAPSGFVKPTLISAELASFLGKTAGTEMARTEVTREINAYIREHQLQDKSNGRIINADTKLSSLLKIPTGEELTYFNLQRYMSPHFTKTVVASA